MTARCAPAAAGAAAAALCAVASACAEPAPEPAGSTIVVTQAPRSVTVPLQLHLAGAPSHEFIVAGGRWRVCDRGTVSNPGDVTAHGVTVLVTYLDHGSVVGRVDAAGAAAAGGAIGDLEGGASRDFTVCGIASNEPDTDTVSLAST